MTTKKEVWLRGTIPGYSGFIQPIAHALLQIQEDLPLLLQDFPENLLWEKPAGMASVAFHLQHITGVIDRMATYARNEPLSEEQFTFLYKEGVYAAAVTVTSLLQLFNNQLTAFLQQLRHTEEHTLTEYRTVGREKLPSTVTGLLTHAAEHSQRHYGQLLVTVKILTHYPPSA